MFRQLKFQCRHHQQCFTTHTLDVQLGITLALIFLHNFLLHQASLQELCLSFFHFKQNLEAVVDTSLIVY